MSGWIGYKASSWPSGAPAALNVSVALTGLSIAATEGSVTPAGDVEILATGQTITASEGSVVVTGDAEVTATGQSITATVGDATVNGDAEIAVTGQTITASEGSVSVNGDVEVAATGLSITATVGDATIQASAVTRLAGLGLAITSSLGDVTESTGSGIDVAAVGMVITASTHAVTSITGSAVVRTTGQILTAILGLVSAVDVIVGLQGMAITTSLGTVIVTGDDNTAVTGSSTPAYGYSLVPPVKDLMGWTVIPAGERIIYCSDSDGDDSNDGLSEATPKKTANAAYNLVRAGHGDQVRFKCGDTFLTSPCPPGCSKSGASAALPIVLWTYGNGPRPIFKTQRANGLNFVSVSHVWVVGLNLYCSLRDPDSPDYDPTLVDPGGFFSTTNCTDIHLEDNEVSFYVMNIEIDPPTRTHDLRILRNVIHNGYQVTGSLGGNYGHNSFIAKITDILFERNVVDHGGWNDTIVGAEYMDQRHNLYNRSILNGTWRYNTISRGSNLGMSITSTDTEVASGNCLIEWNFFCQNGNDFAFGADAPGMTYNMLVQFNDFTETGHTINGADQSDGIGINYALNITIQYNRFFNKPNLGFGAYLSIAAHQQIGLIFINNTIYNWIGADLATSDHSTSKIDCALTPNDTLLSAGTYVDPGRSTGTYDAAWGGDGTWLDAINRARGMRRGVWDDTWTAPRLSQYFNAGFTKVASSASSLTVNPSTDLAVAFTPLDGFYRAILNSSVVMQNGIHLGMATNYVAVGDNPSPLTLGAITSTVLYVMDTTSCVVVHNYAAAKVIYEYRVTGTEDINVIAYVSNLDGSKNINVGAFFLPRMFFAGVATSDAHQEPVPWWADNGGINAYHPSVQTRFGSWYATDGTSGIGFNTRPADNGSVGNTFGNRNAVVLDANTSAKFRDSAWVEYLGAGPGDTKAAMLTFRISATVDKFHLKQPYQIDYRNKHGQQYNADDRVMAESVVADSSSITLLNPYGYFGSKDLQTTTGIDFEKAVGNNVHTAGGSAVVIWNARGASVGLDIYPNWVDLPSATATNLPGLSTYLAAEGIKLGQAARPTKKVVGGTTISYLDLSTTTDLDTVVGYFTTAATTYGVTYYYSDETGNTLTDRIILEYINNATGPNTILFPEFFNDGTLPYGGIYAEMHWSGFPGRYDFMNGVSTAAIDEARWLCPETSTMINISVETNPDHTDMYDFMILHHLTPLVPDSFGDKLLLLAKFPPNFTNNRWNLTPDPAPPQPDNATAMRITLGSVTVSNSAIINLSIEVSPLVMYITEGSPAVSIATNNANVIPTGLIITASLGAAVVVPITGTSVIVPITGLVITAVEGTVTITGDVGVIPTGLVINTILGSPAVTISTNDINVTPDPLVITSSEGVVSISATDVTIIPTGLVITATLGVVDVSPGFSVTVPTTGLVINITEGEIGVSSNGIVVPTTGMVINIIEGIASRPAGGVPVSVPVTGLVITSSLGTVTPSTGSGVSVDATGLIITISEGTVGYTASAQISPVGLVIHANQGSVSIVGTANVTPTGLTIHANEAAISVSGVANVPTLTGMVINITEGTPTPSTGTGNSVAATGLIITITEGTPTAFTSVSLMQTGMVIDVIEGATTVSAGGGVSVPAQGNILHVREGVVVTAASTSIPARGMIIHVNEGTAVPASGATIAATGQVINITEGNVTVAGDVSVRATGLVIHATEGSVGTGSGATVAATGLVINANQGTTAERGTANVAATGLVINASEGSLELNGNVTISLTGLVIHTATTPTAQTGTAVISTTGQVIHINEGTARARTNYSRLLRMRRDSMLGDANTS